MKGLFIPEITAEMFRNGCLESIEVLMSEGQIYDIDYPLEQEPCEDCISRQATVERLCKVAEFMNEKHNGLGSPYVMAALFIQDNKDEFPSVTPKPKTDVLDKIKAEIEEQVLESLSDGGDDWFAAEKVNECLEIIDKYKAESEETDI